MSNRSSLDQNLFLEQEQFTYIENSLQFTCLTWFKLIWKLIFSPSGWRQVHYQKCHTIPSSGKREHVLWLAINVSDNPNILDCLRVIWSKHVQPFLLAILPLDLCALWYFTCCKWYRLDKHKLSKNSIANPLESSNRRYCFPFQTVECPSYKRCAEAKQKQQEQITIMTFNAMYFWSLPCWVDSF